LNPGSILVPYTAIKEIWRDTLIGLEDLVKRLASIDGCRAFILGTPPPVRDPASIQAALEQRDDLFVRQSLYYDIDLETARLTPRSVMWKLWASIQDAMAEVAKTYGAEFIPVPQAFATDDGFLKEIYSQKVDYTHANGAYGLAMRRHLLNELVLRDVHASL
jgi:hypothetical protein